MIDALHDRVGLGPAMPPADRDRGRIDDVAPAPAGLEQAMRPEAVEAGLLDDDHPDRHAGPPLRRRPQPGEQVEQRATVAAAHGMLGQLLAAGRAHGHEPARLAQLERREELGIIPPAGGLRRGRGVTGRHRSPPCCPVAAPTYQAEPPSTRMGSFSVVLTLWVSTM